MDLSTKEARARLREAVSGIVWSPFEPLSLSAGSTIDALLDALDSAHARIERLEAAPSDAEIGTFAPESDMASPLIKARLTRFLEGRKAP